MSKTGQKRIQPRGLYQNQTAGGNVGSPRFWTAVILGFLLWFYPVNDKRLQADDAHRVAFHRPIGTSPWTPTEDFPARLYSDQATAESIGPIANFADDSAEDSPEQLTWRLTRFGWQSVADVTEKHTSPLLPWAMHPLLWGPGLVLLLLAVLIWTTEEWDFDQLFPTAAGTGKC